IPHLYIIIPALLLLIAWIVYRKIVSRQSDDVTIPAIIWKLAGVSVFFYLLAWLLLFYLYVPERYLQFTLPVVIVFMLGWFFNRLANTWAPSKRRLAVLCLLPLFLTAPLWKADVIRLSPDSLALIRFFQSTP